ncbi:MAG: DUF6371 domain-containing protein [Rikenellaceae bacterium]
MTQHRFVLEKYRGGATRHTCPSCGVKRSFTRYVDTEGEVNFPEHVGKCNREDKCGHHYQPRLYFADNPELKDQFREVDYKPAPPPKPPQPTSYISPDMVGKTRMRHQGHHLFTFLASHIGHEATEKLMERYRVATSTHWEGATLFWQMDIRGRARTGKIMLYDPKSGRRVKRPHNLITWVHTRLNQPDYNLKQCFFGEHLLATDTSKKVAIVESEKTALIAAHYLPSFTWIATGGKNGCLQSDAIEVLKGRKVLLVPDLGATEYWQSKLPLFIAKGIDASIFDHLEKTATTEQRAEGYDIADFLLDGNSPEAILQKMIERNPAVQKLIEAFDLELVGVEKHLE